MKHRRVVVAGSPLEAADALELDEPQRRFTRTDVQDEQTVAFMFAGGGAQYPGMGAELHRTEVVYREAVDRCLAILQPLVDYDLSALLYPAPGQELAAARELERPSRTLPALFVTQYAQAQLWMAWGVKPAALIGHSMGEYVPRTSRACSRSRRRSGWCCCAASSSSGCRRGMLSVPLPADGGAELPAELSIAAINAARMSEAGPPGRRSTRCSVSSSARHRGGPRAHRLAAHSAMLEPILEEFRRFFSQVRFGAPTLPPRFEPDRHLDHDAQATSPRYWVEASPPHGAVRRRPPHLAHRARRVVVEVGPGQTLASYARRSGLAVAAISTLRHPDDEIADTVHALTALGQLWVNGIDIDLAPVTGTERRRLRLPTYPFQRERCWIEPGRGAAMLDAPEGEATRLSRRRVGSMTSRRWAGRRSGRRRPLARRAPASHSGPWSAERRAEPIAAELWRRRALGIPRRPIRRS